MITKIRLSPVYFILILIMIINYDNAYSITAIQILNKIDRLEDYKSSMAKFAIIIYPNLYNKKSYRIIKMIGYSKGKENSFYRYVYPNSIRGMKLLTRGDDIWVYFPSTGRKRKIASYNKKQTVEGVGGDFSYQDMTMGEYNKDYYSTIHSENSNQWVLQLKPRSSSHAYNKLLITVSKSNYRISQINYYDNYGFFKTLYLTSYLKIKSYDVPMTMTMVNYRSKSQTILKIIDIRLDGYISDKYFDSNRLESN